jgi:predicted O-methyltransferase YrrM
MGRLLPQDGKLVTIDITPDNAETALSNIRDADLSDKIEVKVGDALEILPRLRDKFDLLFIDATKEEYIQYLKLAEKNLKRGSVVVADNVGIFKADMLDYLVYVRSSGAYKSETISVPLEFSGDVEDAMEISIKL